MKLPNTFKKRLILLASGWILITVSSQCSETRWDTTQHLQAGPLALDLRISKTAHLFHVVDQISRWSEFCHGQYFRYFANLEGGLSTEDRRLLEQHAAIRKNHGWGQGLEQAFYTSIELEPALARAIDQGILTKEEADTERRIFVHFQPRVEGLLSEQIATLIAFERNLLSRRNELTEFALTLSRFVGPTNLTVPFYLIANPDRDSIGGGYNGERLTLEIAAGRDVYPSLLHELFHAFVRTAREKLENAAHTTSGLDAETLDEGLAYAYSPGLIHSRDSDPLLREVANSFAQHSQMTDSYTRFNFYGLALRPLLKMALSNKQQTLETFLPRATDAWETLVDLDKARTFKSESPAHNYRGDPRPSVFVFGIWDEEAIRSLSKAGKNVFGRAHIKIEYQKMIADNSKPGDTILLLLSLDDPQARVPKDFSDLLPLSWAEIETRLRNNETVFAKGKAREMTVVLLATPTLVDLQTTFRRYAATN